MTHLVSKMQFQQPTFKWKCSFQRKRGMRLPLRKTQTNRKCSVLDEGGKQQRNKGVSSNEWKFMKNSGLSTHGIIITVPLCLLSQLELLNERVLLLQILLHWRRLKHTLIHTQETFYLGGFDLCNEDLIRRQWQIWVFPQWPRSTHCVSTDW